ncbi:MAG: glycosyltransferase [Candidatus Moranbacteria bacterium]|nr:glycosyltransferase [Candidatus Moranbacteria bacterium]
MKIIQIIHQYFPNYNSGTEQYTYYLSQFLTSNNHEVVIFTIEPNQKKEKLIIYHHQQVKIYKFYKKSSHLNFKETFKSVKMEKLFHKILKKENPDLAAIQSLIHHSLGYGKILKKQNIPFTISIHDYWFFCPNIKAINSDGKICDLYNKKCYQCAGKYLLNQGMLGKFIQSVFWNQEVLKIRHELVHDFFNACSKIIVFSEFSNQIVSKLIPKSKKKIILINHGVLGNNIYENHGKKLL